MGGISTPSSKDWKILGAVVLEKQQKAAGIYISFHSK